MARESGMIFSFIPSAARMVRRTLSLPDAIDQLVRANAGEGESYSAAAARLIALGATRSSGNRPRYVAAGEGPEDLGRRAEAYLRDLVVVTD
jgi:hypothetical protein